MSAKQFFKGTAFKCIVVLLSILLVCGILLTICNALFYVSEQEKLDRVLGKIYGESVETEEISLDDLETKFNYGEVNKVYKVTKDGNYIINASGTGGYGGAITSWVVVKVENNAVSGVGNVLIDTAPGETLTSSIPAEVYQYYSQHYVDGEAFDVNDIHATGLITGVTLSTTAITNGVNTAVDFVKSQILGQSIAGNPYENYAYIEYIDGAASSHTVDENGVITYDIKTTGLGVAGAFELTISVGADKKVTAFNIDVNGSTYGYNEYMMPDILDGTYIVGKGAEDFLAVLGENADDTSLSQIETGATGSSETHATKSNFLCLYAALFATANYDEAYTSAMLANIVNTEYIEMDATAWTVADGVITYDIKTTGLGVAGAFELTISVGADKKVTAFNIDVNGSTYGYNEYMMPDILDGTYIVGKSAEDFLAVLGENADDTDLSLIETGATGASETHATKSNFLCLYAAYFATSNYDLALTIGGKA